MHSAHAWRAVVGAALAIASATACSGASGHGSSSTAGSTGTSVHLASSSTSAAATSSSSGVGSTGSSTTSSSTSSVSASSGASSSSSSSSSGIAFVTDFAGNGFPGYVDGPVGPFAVAELNTPTGVVVDAHGNVFVADEQNNRIREIDPSGNVTTFAGNGTPGFADGTSGPDGGAELRLPNGIAMDARGNLYVADFGTNRIRKVAPAGVVSTVAGNGTPGFADGTGGPNGTASFHGPTGVAVDDGGNLYVADSLNNRVRKIDPAGNATTLAGNGYPGFADGVGGPDGGAELKGPSGVTVDGAGNVYVADTGNGRVRRIASTSVVSTVAGNGTIGFADGTGGPDGGAEFDGPSGVVVDGSGNVFVADFNNNRIRKIDASGNVTTVAGTGQAGFVDGPGGPDGGAQFDTPFGVALDDQGRIYVADSVNDRVRRIDASGNVSTLGGNGAPGFADGSPAAPATAEFFNPSGVAVDPAGNVLVADTSNNRIRRVSTQGTVETVAGNGVAAFADGSGGPDGGASFSAPLSVVADAMGNVLVADTGNNRIRRIDASGAVTTLAGNGVAGWSDGSGGPDGGAEFKQPNGVAIDTAGNVYVADTGNNRVRKIDASGNVTTVAGNGNFGYQDGTGGANGTAEFTYPYAVAVDAAGMLTVVDYGNLRIRQIDVSGNVTTLAGDGMLGFFDGTGGANGSAEFTFPEGVAVDGAGNVYIADSGNNAIRKIDGSGNVTTIVGSGDGAFADGYGVPGGPAELNYPIGLAVDRVGTLYVADSYNNCVRRITWQ